MSVTPRAWHESRQPRSWLTCNVRQEMKQLIQHQLSVRRLTLFTLVKICYIACLVFAVSLCSLVALVAYATQGRLSTDRSLTNLQALGVVAALCVFWPLVFGPVLGLL